MEDADNSRWEDQERVGGEGSEHEEREREEDELGRAEAFDGGGARRGVHGRRLARVDGGGDVAYAFLALAGRAVRNVFLGPRALPVHVMKQGRFRTEVEFELAGDETGVWWTRKGRNRAAKPCGYGEGARWRVRRRARFCGLRITGRERRAIRNGTK